MKRHFFIPILTIIALSSCSQQPELQESNNIVNKITVTSEPLVDGDVVSRVDVNIGSKITYQFNATDTLGIFPEIGDQVSFPLSGSIGQSYTTFDGGGWQLKDGIKYCAYLPFSRKYFASYDAQNSITVSWIGQYQKALNDRTGIGNFVYMSTDPVTSANGELTFSMQQLGILSILEVPIPANGKYAKVYLKTTDDVFPVVATYNLPVGRTLTPKKLSNKVELSLGGMSLTKSASGSFESFWLMFPPANCTGKTINVVLVDTNGNRYESEALRTDKNNDFVTGKYYRFTATTMTPAGTEDPSTESQTGNVPFDPEGYGDPD